MPLIYFFSMYITDECNLVFVLLPLTHFAKHDTLQFHPSSPNYMVLFFFLWLHIVKIDLRVMPQYERYPRAQGGSQGCPGSRENPIQIGEHKPLRMQTAVQIYWFSEHSGYTTRSWCSRVFGLWWDPEHSNIQAFKENHRVMSTQNKTFHRLHVNVTIWSHK